MREKLDARNDSKSTASKITKMVELVPLRDTSLNQHITQHIDKMAATFENLKAMQATMDESFSVGIIIALIEVIEIHSVVAAIKTLDDADVK